MYVHIRLKIYPNSVRIRFLSWQYFLFFISLLIYMWLYDEFFIILYDILKIAECWDRLLSNYNIKYTCTIYTRLDTCPMHISRFSLREKVTLRLLKLHFYGADVVVWSRALDERLSEWCCSVSMVWVQN